MRREFNEALDMLKEIPDQTLRYQQMICYFSTLIKQLPFDLLDTLESHLFKFIKHAELMPGFLYCPENARQHAIAFIRNFCIKERQNFDVAVHNMLFYLYCQSENSKEVVKFL